MSVNKVTLLGHLGNKPDVKTVGDTQVATFSLATNEEWKDKQGVKQSRVEWHRIVAWGKKAEICGKYLDKGKQVYIEGKLATRDWEDKEGVKRYTTEIIADNVQFVGPSDGARRDAPPPSGPPGAGGSQMDETPL